MKARREIRPWKFPRPKLNKEQSGSLGTRGPCDEKNETRRPIGLNRGLKQPPTEDQEGPRAGLRLRTITKPSFSILRSFPTDYASPPQLLTASFPRVFIAFSLPGLLWVARPHGSTTDCVSIRGAHYFFLLSFLFTPPFSISIDLGVRGVRR